MAKAQHVVAAPSGGWSVVSSGAGRARKQFREKSEAIAFARKIAEAQRVALYIHAADGTVREKDRFAAPKDAERV